MQLCSVLLLTTVLVAPVKAQTPAAAETKGKQTEARCALASMPRVRFPGITSDFRLMPAASARTNTGSRSSAISLMPMAANLQVLGGGTLGRLTKWTGFHRATQSSAIRASLRTRTDS